ncbi:TatD DNase domain containing 1-like protein, partial [Aphelenchoides avenae]
MSRWVKRVGANPLRKGTAVDQAIRVEATVRRLASEPIRPQRPLDTNTVMRMIQNGEFVIDAHVHSMEYTGKYFNNADRYSQWSLGFPENTPFGGFIDVYHDPAVWNFPAQNKIDHPVAYVNRRYGHILPPTKRLGCAVACHPKFAHPKFSRAKNKIDFYGSPILCIGEFGLEFGTSDEEKTARFTDVSPAQKELFRMHVELAMKYRFPIMLHIRGRDPDVQDKLEMMAINLLLDKGFPQDLPIIRHTYCGSRSRAMEWLKEFPNTYFSYSKASMKWKSSKRCMSEFDVPLDRTIVETDAPLLDFDQNQGLRRNDPRRIPAHSDDVLVVLKELQSARNLTMEDVIAKCTLNTIEAFSIPNARLEASLVCPPPVRVEQQDSRDYRHFYPQARPQYERRQDQPDEDSDSHDDDDPDQPRGSGTGGGKATSRVPPRGTSGQGAKTSRRRQEFPQHGEDFGDDAGTASGRRVSDLRETYSPALPRTSRRQTREERGRERMERDLDRQRRQARRADEDDASWQNPYDEPNPLERELEAVTAARREAMRQRELREQQDSPLQQQHDRLPPPPAPPALIPPPPPAGGAGTVPPPPRQIPPPPPAANQQQAQAQQDQPIQMEQDQQQDEPE